VKIKDTGSELHYRLIYRSVE